MATAETLPLDRDITAAVIEAMKLAFNRTEIIAALEISIDRLRMLESGRGRLSVREMEQLERKTGSDYELWAMVTARRRARTPEHHASLDHFYRVRKLKEIVAPMPARKLVKRSSALKKQTGTRLSA
jgi:hypothetical protein